jgi:hypothetical protein
MFIPDPKFSYRGSRIQGQKDSGSRFRIRIKELKYFIPNNWFFALGNVTGMFIQDPDLDFLPIPDPGCIKTPTTL